MKSGSFNKVWVTTSVLKPKKDVVVNKYFQEIRTILFMQRLIGRFPYSFDNNGLKPFKLFSIPSVYTFFFFIVQTFWTTYTVCVVCQQKIYKAPSYDEALYWISILLLTIINYTVPYTNWFEAHKMGQYIEQWKRFQEEHTLSGLQYKPSLIGKIIPMVSLPMCFFFVGFEIYLLADMPFEIFAPYTTIMCSMILSQTLWIVTFMRLRNLSRQLLNKIMQDVCKDLSYHRRTWLALSKLVSGVGDVHGSTGLTGTTILFACLVLNMYAILSFLFEYKKFSNSIVGLLISAAISASSLFLACDSAHRTTYEVGRYFGSKILSLDLTNLSENDVSEVSLLLQTMSSNSPDVEFFGFVTVNRYLFVSFISNAVTYLIVLVQFKASSPETFAELVNRTFQNDVSTELSAIK